ncbi:MAG: hypothetical protein SCARUB_03662 [Candidatus Scalindua rubra]|uniref:Sulfatase-modifying factor enzyme-like domain-containing protein n=1 Tax=Candidatus Scalindua rubra TaxID=1872076 RepID=A0A1E3X6J2_9BACT|nr:MAG: hypothetical protein SCARUB_03662 [Candidatus Scalindua rubra]
MLESLFDIKTFYDKLRSMNKIKNGRHKSPENMVFIPEGPFLMGSTKENPFFGRPENVGTSIYELKPSTLSSTLSNCKVLRGGSWNGSGVIHIRCANRDYDEPTYKNDTIGFRCAMSLDRITI